MFTTYINTSSASTPGTPLDTAGKNVEVFKLLIGNPVASANITFWRENNVGNVSTNTTGIVAKQTLPGSFATGQLPFTIDLSDENGHGMLLDGGGTVGIDQTIQLTILWDYARQPSNAI